jgi:hypothetical protein
MAKPLIIIMLIAWNTCTGQCGDSLIHQEKRFFIRRNALMSGRQVEKLLLSGGTSSIHEPVQKARRSRRLQTIAFSISMSSLGAALSFHLLSHDPRNRKDFRKLEAGLIGAAGVFLISTDILRDNKKKNYSKAIKIYNQQF